MEEAREPERRLTNPVSRVSSGSLSEWRVEEHRVWHPETAAARFLSDRRKIGERRRTCVALPFGNRRLRDAADGGELALRDAEDLGSDVADRVHDRENKCELELRSTEKCVLPLFL